MDAISDHPTTASVADLAARLARIEALVLPRDARWLGVGDVATRCGVTRQAVHAWIRSGRLGDHARQWRGRWEIDPAWVASHLAMTTPRKDPK